MFMKSSQDQIRIAHFEWYLPFHNRNWDGEIDVSFLFSFTVGTSKKRGHWGCSTAKLDFFGVERLVMMDVLPRSWKDMIFETWKWDVSWVTLSDLFKLSLPLRRSPSGLPSSPLHGTQLIPRLQIPGFSRRSPLNQGKLRDSCGNPTK